MSSPNVLPATVFTLDIGLRVITRPHTLWSPAVRQYLELPAPNLHRPLLNRKTVVAMSTECYFFLPAVLLLLTAPPAFRRSSAVAERSRDASCHWILFSLSLKVRLKVIPNDILSMGMCKSLLVFHCNGLHLVPFLRYSASNNGVTLKCGLGVIQGNEIVR